MNNSITINGKNIELTEDQVKLLVEALCAKDESAKKQLSDFAAGRTVKIGKFEMVVLDQQEGQTALILKGMYGTEFQFSEEGNCYNGSNADKKCQEFAQELSEVIGWDNIMPHTVDLTSDDGLDDYGAVERCASLITAEMYRKFVKVLDTCNPKCFWWLATPYSTKHHENNAWVKCVAPSGYFNYDYYFIVNGVRPFCILKSTIFVS